MVHLHTNRFELKKYELSHVEYFRCERKHKNIPISNWFSVSRNMIAIIGILQITFFKGRKLLMDK